MRLRDSRRRLRVYSNSLEVPFKMIVKLLVETIAMECRDKWKWMQENFFSKTNKSATTYETLVNSLSEAIYGLLLVLL